MPNAVDSDRNHNGSSPAYAWFVVAILMIAYVFSFIDRQILNLLVGPIRRDLGISDTQISLLMGFSFALFYTLCGIPLGRMADHRSRRGLIAAGVVLWSLMTAFCGLARTYTQLLLFRIGVGVGEAALSPAAYSMIADYFPPSRRATAISVYAMGIYIGSGLAFLLGGLVIRFASGQGEIDLPIIGMTRPWQLVFLIIGAAGLVFTFAFLLVREPPRTGVGAQGQVAFREVLAHLALNRRTVFCHCFGFACLTFCAYGASAWVPTFFVRTYGWEAGTVGITYGSLVMVFGSLGIFTGGRLADRWLAQGRTDAHLRIGLYAAIAAIPFSIAFPLAPDGVSSMLLLTPTVFCLGLPFGVAPAAIQEIVPNQMRGQASAVYLFVVNFVGLGFGPTAVAALTDYGFGDDQALRYSLLIVSTLACAAAIGLLAAGLRPYRESYARMRG